MMNPPLNCRKKPYWKYLIPDNFTELYLSSVCLSKHTSYNLQTKRQTLNIIRPIIHNKFERFGMEFFKLFSELYFSISNRCAKIKSLYRYWAMNMNPPKRDSPIIANIYHIKNNLSFYLNKNPPTATPVKDRLVHTKIY